jgi:hypothetical protein
VKHSQYECAVVERLEDDQVISVWANPYRVAQVWTRRAVMRSVRNLLAVLPYFANERDSAPLAGVECGATKEGMRRRIIALEFNRFRRCFLHLWKTLARWQSRPARESALGPRQRHIGLSTHGVFFDSEFKVRQSLPAAATIEGVP